MTGKSQHPIPGVATEKWRRLALAAAATVFLAWTAWLAYEAVTTSKVIVVSRPQLLIAPLVIEAKVPEGAGPERDVTVTQVYQDNTGIIRSGAILLVTDLGRARGWQGPGDYILALQLDDEKKPAYRLVPTPPSPGFRPLPGSELAEPAIYPANESTRLQVRAILGR